MLIKHVDLPEALVEAHRTGSLVLFVGAGVSRDAPSSLPDFRKLAKDVAADFEIAATDEELARPDEYLGRLADRGFDVHRRVAAHLNHSSSAPNRLHKALIRLATSGPTLRIVTTNYDRHLSAVLGESHYEEFKAPALPLGHEFSGLVYLHGSLDQDPERLVVTDRDFGRAYLSYAWAARFLERMFDRYTVLFIGYSHDDTVMRYMARAMGETSRRFILTSKPGSPDWRSLGLHPIGYEVEGESHVALVEAIEGWDRRARMGLLDHRQRIVELVSSDPPHVPEEVAYLEDTLRSPERARLFAELARGEAWLRWAATQAPFQHAVDPSSPPNDVARVLAGWFAEQVTTDEKLSRTGLAIVREAGGRMSETAIDAISVALQRVEGDIAPWLRPWIALVCRRPPRRHARLLNYTLEHLSVASDLGTALVLFDQLTEPTLVFVRYSFGDTISFEMSTEGEHHALRDVWIALLKPRLKQIALQILAIADRHLRLAHELLGLAGSTRAEWDPISMGRAAIEPHPQDRYPDGLDVLVDAARDALEFALENRLTAAGGRIDEWAACDVPILRRLAFHGTRKRGDLEGNEKLVWLLSNTKVLDRQLRHEIFGLLSDALPTSSEAQVESLIEQVQAEAAEIDDARTRAYAQFNAFMWIERHASQSVAARAAATRIQAEHSDFKVSEHPDLLVWSGAESYEDQPVVASEDLHHRIGDDPEEAVSQLRTLSNASSTLAGPTWHGSLGTLTQVVAEHPEDGLLVLRTRHRDAADVVAAVARGWSQADITPDVVDEAAQVLRRCDLTVTASAVAELLSTAGQQDRTAWHRSKAARDLARDLWSHLEPGEVVVGTTDWLTTAINDPAGDLAQFWVRVVAIEWSKAGDAWRGVPASIREAIEAMIGSADHRSALAEVVLASQVHFFFRADPDWCQQHILRLLDWDDVRRARRSWDGFLRWGRWDDQLLEAGLLARYHEAAEHVEELGDEAREALAAHFAGIAVTSDLDPIPIVRRFVATVPLSDRAEWVIAVAELLEELDAVADAQWSRWIAAYWRSRLDGVPIPMTVEEASAMAEWVVLLSESFDEGVGLAVAHKAGFAGRGEVLRRLAKRDLSRDGRHAARLVHHLMRHTDPPFWDRSNLSRVFAALRDAADPADLRGIKEQALRLGLLEAAAW